MGAIMETAEPILAYVRERLQSGGSVQEGEKPEETARALAACRTYLEIHRPPVYQQYNPGRLIREGTAELQAIPHVLDIDPAADCIGDPAQVADCVLLVLCGVRPDPESRVFVEVFEGEETPGIAVSLDGPGTLPTEIALGGYFRLSLDELRARWTVATRGGRIDRAANGFLLRLKGMRECPASHEEAGALLAKVREAEERLARGETSEALKAVQDALTMIDAQETRPEPGDLAAVLTHVVEDFKPRLVARGIETELWCEENVPPIVMSRSRIRGVVANALCHALASLPGAGAISLLTDYDVAARVAGVAFSAAGPGCQTDDSHYIASIRRAVVEGHGGRLDASPEGEGHHARNCLPRSCRRTLDTWIPGFERFSERSVQVLRLLKSGGQAPPEELFLPNILDAELRGWLLDKIQAPAAVNLAHGLPSDDAGLSDSSSERRRKALDQIKQGRARKETVQPRYAGEILWAFRIDERHRRAVGVDSLDDAALEAFCAGLLATPPRYVECLRCIAAARAAEPGEDAHG